MPRAEEFDAFYAHTRSRLLHQTYAFSGDLGAAAAALRDAFAHSWQRWRKLRTRDAEAWVRQEAKRLATLRHSAHLRRRLDDSGADTELLDALHALPTQARRLLLLQMLAELDLHSAAREVGVTDATALEATDKALAALTTQLSGRSGDVAIANLETRLDGLRSVSERVAMPRAATIRHQGRRGQRRGTLAAVVATTAVVAAAGVVVMLPTAAVPEVVDRQEVGEPSRPTPSPDPEVKPEPPGADLDQLLTTSQLFRLDDRAWRVAPGARDDVYSICQPRLTADPRAQDSFVRTYRTDTEVAQQVAQAVEVSRDVDAARDAYDAMVGWYAGCQRPRLQLVSDHTVNRRGGDIEILSLRAWHDPLSTITVALSRTGLVTTALVHEVDRPEGPSPQAMTNTMSRALERLCRTTGGRCGTTHDPFPSPLPPTGEGLGFLGVVDLPPVGDLRTVWAGTEPIHTPATNPAATLCDQADFTGSPFVQARSRTFVMPESKLPQRFGLSETVGFASSPGAAEGFVTAAVGRVQSCPDRELSAQVDSDDTIGTGDVEGQVWQLTFEVADGAEVSYRLGIVRVGARVAELSFSGTPDADIGDEAFAALVLRAGERLDELQPPKP